jgi:hypothetical protein
VILDVQSPYAYDVESGLGEKSKNPTSAGKLDEVEVPEEPHAFAVKWSASENKKEAGNDDDLRANLAKELATCEATIDGLIDMRARHEIGEDDFKRRNENAQKEKARIKGLIADFVQEDDASLAEAVSDAYRFVAYAKKKLKEGGPEAQRAIFGALGSNRTLIDKKLNVDVEETLLPMKKVSLAAKAVHDQVRTAGLPATATVLNDFYSKSNTLLPVPEVIISIITDREYMENLYRDYCFLRELERSKVAV